MNRINPNKLLNSKWTAMSPTNKEKHFIITEVEIEEDIVISCCIEALMTKRTIEINWQDLKDDSMWAQGWK